MAIRTLPIEEGVLAFSFKTTLDSTPYEFSFTFNERAQLWTMNIKDDAGTDLVLGIPIYVNQLLLSQFQYDSRLPQGNLMAMNLIDGASPPVKDNFGTDVIMVYEEAS